MRQFFTVFKFELLGQLQSKIFRVITILLVIAILLSLNFTRIENALGTSISDLGGEKEATKVAVQNNSEMDTKALIDAFSEAFGEDYEITEAESKDLKANVKNGDLDSAIIIDLRANMSRDISPPDAILLTSAGATPLFAENRNIAWSMPLS